MAAPKGGFSTEVLLPGGSSSAASPELSSGSSSCTMPLPPAAMRSPPVLRKPKRNSFPCLTCGKTFPSQQAMAGHCSVHTRDRQLTAGQPQRPPGGVGVKPAFFPPRGMQGRELDVVVAGSSATGRYVPAAVVPYASYYLPYVHSLGTSQQVPRVPSVHAMPNPALWTAASRTAARYGRATSSCPVLPVAGNAPTNAALSLSQAYSVNQPGRGMVQTTLRLGSSRGGDRVEKRAWVPLLQEGRECKRAVVGDGGDQGGKGMEGLDLELRLSLGP
ncbi:hypothetical protein ACP4OV_001498 [Aristida adscensionis]